MKKWARCLGENHPLGSNLLLIDWLLDLFNRICGSTPTHLPSLPVVRSRPVPKAIKTATSLKKAMLDASAEKEDRRRKHSRKGESNPKAERKKVVITVRE
jgi:Sof1-like domain